MSHTTHTIDGALLVVADQAVSLTRVDGSRERSTSRTERGARVHAARLALALIGWSVRGPSTLNRFRLPIMRHDLGDRLGSPLCASKWRHRAEGLVADLWAPMPPVEVRLADGSLLGLDTTRRKLVARLIVDASGDLPIEHRAEGDAAEQAWVLLEPILGVEMSELELEFRGGRYVA